MPECSSASTSASVAASALTDASHSGLTRSAALRAIMSKEWREQRWRFVLAAAVLSGLLGGMLRAQIIPMHEAALLIYWPVGVVLAVFLATGSVAAERAAGTWEFLIARPVTRADVLIAKWRVGVLQLIGTMAAATVFGAIGLWLRGFRITPQDLDLVSWAMQRAEGPPLEVVLRQFGFGHPILWLFAVGIVSTASLVFLYTPLFFILARGRNEFAAALAGIMLTIAVHLWLMQLWVMGSRFYGLPDWWGGMNDFSILMITGLFNPLSPMAGMVSLKSAPLVPVLLAVHGLLYVVLPLRLVRRFAGRAVTA